MLSFLPHDESLVSVALQPRKNWGVRGNIFKTHALVCNNIYIVKCSQSLE